MVVRTSPAGTLSLTLRAKYLLLVCAAVVVATAVSGISYFVWIERLTVAKATDSLMFQTQLVATQVKLNVEQLRNDVLTVSRMPPVQGIIRSGRNGGIDPADGSTDAQWRNRLEAIFTSTMTKRVDYVQMRYIGLAGDGLELVRVDRDKDGHLRTTEEEDLQTKASQPYFQESLTLAPGEVYFSDITPNVDFDRTEFENPMLRAVTPVVDSSGVPFGFVLINAHFGALIQGILAQIPPSPDLFIVTDAGDFVHRSAAGVVDPLVLAQGSDRLPGAFGRAIREDGTDPHGPTAKIYDDRVVATVRFAPDVAIAPTLAVALSQTREDLLAEVFETRRKAIVLALGLILLVAVPGFFISRRLTGPLLRLATDLRTSDPGRSEIDLPVDRGDEVGEVARAIDVLIARRRRIEAIQASTLARLQSILDRTVDAIVTVDATGTVQSFNRAATRIFGYEADDIIGHGADLLLLDTSRAAVGAVSEQEVRTADGRKIPVELSVSEVQTAEGKFFSCIVRAIGERKRLEAAVRAHADALERSNAELEEFAYIASHDLKEPLRAISNHTQFLAEDQGDKLDEDGHRRIARLKELCVRADRLITDLLHFSRLGRDELRIDAVDIGGVVEAVRAGLVDYLKERNGEIRTVGELPIVRGDRSRLTSLIYNLVVNGLKYNDQGARYVEIGVREGRNRDRVIVFVRDNGIGIAPEFRDSVFKIFKRLHSEKAYGAGSGVGLSFARKIVERHGGRLTFDSTPGSGTIFFFDLQRTGT
ncbi:ATP-binding protein [Thalassobaculum sp. OXR-137]|uniref:sensor histidine kinase n=1 Tax=Thalassobaculum sp. OXR-137 TaxID=3100173 RepID=UPI002AC948F0|nr:ATP-binding protein [Thalassobaculum sp. OXR-137]WPZ33116.1 ATP-binding protein [Thalassobaculum sp. OXR-137]